ncbi:MAG: coproporphyrinogen III oxidase [Rhabdochlamydiaceae bacterium]
MNRREEIVQFLKTLRDEIITAFEEFETYATFERTGWHHTTGGGGEISLLRGSVFEKAAVNWSAVSGPNFPIDERDDSSGPFFATGVSLITHMHNPHAPTVHMNVRYIETEKESWFGGGYDLTPMGFPYAEDTDHFHTTAKKALGPALYTQFSEAAKKYFYIPHRQKERGTGGLFFDHYNDITVWKAVAHSLLPAIMPIYHRRIHTPFTPYDKDQQLQLRAHYVEFNLLYDRGTKFGFLSGGNPDAILCSMPPIVKW